MTPLRIVGYGSYQPRNQRPSTELHALFAKPAGWTEEQFGIRLCGVAAEDETSSQMGAAAVREAIAMAGWRKGEFDVLVGACAVMEQPIPGTSVLIQQALGLGKSGIWAFDINQTCLSFLTALDVVAMGFAAGRFTRAVIVASDIASAGLDKADPQTFSIFGDGARRHLRRSECGSVGAWAHLAALRDLRRRQGSGDLALRRHAHSRRGTRSRRSLTDRNSAWTPSAYSKQRPGACPSSSMAS